MEVDFLTQSSIIPSSREGVKKFKTDRDREGEAPAEPHGTRTCWGDGSPGGSPCQFFTALLQEGNLIFIARGDPKEHERLF